MMEKEKTPASAATLTGAMETGTPAKMTSTSTTDSTTTGGSGQMGPISGLLLCGAENAISRRDLMALTGYKDRELRLLIEAERRQGIPILSDCVGGYYLPASEEERQRCVRSLRRRAAEIRLTAAYVAKAVMNHER